MSTPPDGFHFVFLPNDDSDPKREAEATRAVREAIERMAREHGIEVRDQKEAPAHESIENEGRAQKIERELEPKLVESTAHFRRETVIEEEHHADGSSTRRASKIVEGRFKLSVSIEELQKLVDKCTYGIGGAVRLTCKAVNWAMERVNSRK